MNDTQHSAARSGPQVLDNAESGSYDALVDGQTAGTLVYEHASDRRIVFTHTIVEPQFRNRGIGSALVRAALDDVRAKGLTLTNLCGFVAHYLRLHPEYQGLLDPAHPGPAGHGAS